MVAEGEPRPAPTPRFDPVRLSDAFAVAERAVADGVLPAAVVAVAGPSGPIRARAFGDDALVDDALADGTRVGVHHRFPIASITKPIVATAVVGLAGRGLLSLETLVADLVPGFAPEPTASGRDDVGRITVWHLLTHTSGIVDLDWSPPEPPPTREALLRAAMTGRLAFVPGTAYRYASDSFFLLGDLLCRLGGHATVEAALREALFVPLGMAATGFDPAGAGLPRVRAHDAGSPDEVAESHARWRGALQHPGGGLWSTAADLVAFGRMILGGGSVGGARVLASSWLELMLREQTAGLLEPGDPPRRPGYGLGWGKSALLGRMPGSASQVDHKGASGSRLWVDPGHGLVVVVLANRWGAPEWPASSVIGAVYGALDDARD